MSAGARMRPRTTTAIVVPTLVMSWSAMAAVVLLKILRASMGLPAKRPSIAGRLRGGSQPNAQPRTPPPEEQSQQLLFCVPLRRTPCTLVEIHSRHVTKHAPRLRNIRRPILAEELHTPRI